MPWCDDCAKYWTPTSMPPDGTCQTCGAVIADPPDTSIPWHFWVLLVSLVVYLGWRVVQGFQWLAENDQPILAVALAIVLVALAIGVVGLFWWRHRSRSPNDRSGDSPGANLENT